jgi:hypothetical protein
VSIRYLTRFGRDYTTKPWVKLHLNSGESEVQARGRDIYCGACGRLSRTRYSYIDTGTGASEEAAMSFDTVMRSVTFVFNNRPGMAHR